MRLLLSPSHQAYGTSSFQQCKVEAEEVMAEISVQLQAQVAMQDLPVEQQALAVELLQQLGHEVCGRHLLVETEIGLS